MSLTGDLSIFPLEEVLRLLARSKKSGCLRVDAAGQQGRIFLAGGSLTLATTVADDDFRRQVINAGLVTEEDFRRLEGGEAALPDVLAPGVSTAALTDFVREHVVESLYRIQRPGRGAFDFVVEAAPRYPTGQSFDAEVALSEADRRANEWADIESVVTDLQVPIRMARELPDENNVTISPPTWRVLASLEGGASVIQVADILGLSEFRAAREMASLLRSGLVEYQQPATPAEPAWAPPAAPEPEPPAATWEAPEWQQTPQEPQAQPGSWEQQPAQEAAAEPRPAPEPGETNHATDATAGWWAEAVEEQPQQPAQAEQQQEDDAFLESVFSQLDEEQVEAEPEDEDETGFSMGLLRRRRMGAAAREIGDQD